MIGRAGDLLPIRRRRHRIHDGNGMGPTGAVSTTPRCSTLFLLALRADELSDSLKITMLLGQYFTKHYRGHFYSAQNLNRAVPPTTRP
jgi:hypothetical protein